MCSLSIWGLKNTFFFGSQWDPRSREPLWDPVGHWTNMHIGVYITPYGIPYPVVLFLSVTFYPLYTMKQLILSRKLVNYRHSNIYCYWNLHTFPILHPLLFIPRTRNVVKARDAI